MLVKNEDELSSGTTKHLSYRLEITTYNLGNAIIIRVHAQSLSTRVTLNNCRRVCELTYAESGRYCLVMYHEQYFKKIWLRGLSQISEVNGDKEKWPDYSNSKNNSLP